MNDTIWRRLTWLERNTQKETSDIENLDKGGYRIFEEYVNLDYFRILQKGFITLIVKCMDLWFFET